MSDAIHQHFGLSYANYLVLPRTVLQSMPDEWQERFVQCLDELEELYGDQLDVDEYSVRVKCDGKYATDPLADYERGRRKLVPTTD